LSGKESETHPIQEIPESSENLLKKRHIAFKEPAMPTLEMISPDETDNVTALFHATEAGNIAEMQRLLVESSVVPVDAEEEGSGVTALCIASGLATSLSCSGSACCVFS
jgi:hypothetical protein